MKVELKPIIDQLTDALELSDGYKVSALVDDEDETIIGWTIVEVHKDGSIEPLKAGNDILRFENIRELFNARP